MHQAIDRSHFYSSATAIEAVVWMLGIRYSYQEWILSIQLPVTTKLKWDQLYLIVIFTFQKVQLASTLTIRSKVPRYAYRCLALIFLLGTSFSHQSWHFAPSWVTSDRTLIILSILKMIVKIIIPLMITVISWWWG